MATELLYPSVRPSLDLNFARSKSVDPRITFTRASGATYYDGVTVAKAEENLLVRSQEFDATSWVKINVSSVANSATAPDGTVTADTLTFDALPGALAYQSVTVASGTYTFSVYAKTASGTKQFKLQRYGATASTATSTALVATTDWQRFTFTVTANSEGTAWYLLNDAAGTAGDLIVWGAQLEQRSQVTAYTPTTAQPITNYIPVLQTAPANVPRIDYDPVTGECKGLLVEEQRTNMVSRSEDFTAAAWAKNGCSIYADQMIAPDGTLSADLVEFSSTGHINSANYSATVAGAHTFSFFVKAHSGLTGAFNFIIRNGSTSTNLVVASVTWSNMVVSANGSLTALANGWYRLSVTATSGISAGDLILGYPVSNASAGFKFFLWGAQLEAGAFPTSYIKTEASQVTRAADSASMTGANFSSWYRQDEGTLFADYVQGLSQTNQTLFSLTNDSGVNQVTLYNDSQASAGISPSLFVSNGVTQSLIAFSATASSKSKLGGVYAYNNFYSAFDGVISDVDTAGEVPTSTKAWIGRNHGGAYANSHIKRIAYYPKRLSDIELKSLTT